MRSPTFPRRPTLPAPASRASIAPDLPGFPMTPPAAADPLLELMFAQSLDGIFFMMLDEPLHWGGDADPEAQLDYIFAHQRVTRANDAMRARSARSSSVSDAPSSRAPGSRCNPEAIIDIAHRFARHRMAKQAGS